MGVVQLMRKKGIIKIKLIMQMHFCNTSKGIHTIEDKNKKTNEKQNNF